LTRIFQVLSVTIARSPRARIFACVRFTDFCRRDSFGPEVASLDRGTHAAAGALVSLVGQGRHVGAGQRVDDAVGAGGGQVMGRAG